MPSKKFLFAILAIISAVGDSSAQITSNKSPYILPEFVNATVLQKGGATVQAQMNYNMVTQEMMFTKDGANLVLDNYDNVDTIYLGNRKFVPARQIFLEKLTNGKVPLYLQNKGKALLVGAVTAANSSNNSAIGGLVGTKGVKGDAKITSYALTLPDGYQFSPEPEYWLQKDGAFAQANTVKKIAKFFPGKEEFINNFIRQNNISLTKTDDMIKLIEFCNKQ